MVFSLKINEGKLLKGIIETLSTIVGEVEIIIDVDGLSITAMDPSRICLLRYTMSKDKFDEFGCKKSHNIAVNLSDLDKILKRSTQKDSLELTFKDQEQKIKIVMNQPDKRKRTFSLMLLDFKQQPIPMENLLGLEYETNWSMDTEYLVESIRDAEIYSEIMTMVSSGGGVQFSAIGQIGELEYELDSEVLEDFSFDDVSKGSYSLIYLRNILKLSSITKQLDVSLRTDHPIKLVFTLLDDSVVNYFLAPRVEQEDYDEDDLTNDF